MARFSGAISDYTDARGRYRTKSLFEETILQQQRDAGIVPMYTFESLRRLYMETNDPTEYKFAQAFVGSWRHFEYMCSLKWFKEIIEELRMELEISLKSQAITSMILVSNTEGAKGITASKWLADKGWEKKRGRPSREEIQRERKIHASVSADVEEDAKRMGLHAVK